MKRIKTHSTFIVKEDYILQSGVIGAVEIQVTLNYSIGRFEIKPTDEYGLDFGSSSLRDLNRLEATMRALGNAVDLAKSELK